MDSHFFRIFGKDNFPPNKYQGGENCNFTIFSLKTVVHLFVSLNYFIIGYILILNFASTGYYIMFAGAGLYELVSIVLMTMSMLTGLFIPILLSAGLTSLSPETILRNDLRFPKKAYRIIIGL